MATIDNRTPIQSANSPTSFDASVPIEGVQFSPRPYSPEDFYAGDWAAISEAVTGFGSLVAKAIDLKTADVVGEARLKAAQSDLEVQNMRQRIALKEEQERTEDDTAARIIADVELNHPADFVAQDKELGVEVTRFDPDSPAAQRIRSQQASLRERYVLADKNEAERRANEAVNVRAMQAVGSSWSRFEQRFMSDPEFRSSITSHKYPVEAAIGVMKQDMGVEMTPDLELRVDSALEAFRNNASDLITREWREVWKQQDQADIAEATEPVPNAHLVPVTSIVDSVEYALSDGLHSPVPVLIRQQAARETALRSIMSIEVPNLPRSDNIRLRMKKLDEFRAAYPTHDPEKLVADKLSLTKDLANTVQADIMSTVMTPAVEYARTLSQNSGIPIDTDAALYQYSQTTDPMLVSKAAQSKVKPSDPPEVRAAAMEAEARLNDSAARGRAQWERAESERLKSVDILQKMASGLPLSDEDLNAGYKTTNLSRYLRFQAPLDARIAGAELNGFLSRGRPPSDMIKDFGVVLSSPDNRVRGQAFAVLATMTPDNADRMLTSMQSMQETADIGIAAKTAYLLQQGNNSGNIVERYDDVYKAVRSIGSILSQQPSKDNVPAAFKNSTKAIGDTTYDNSSWGVIRSIYAIHASTPSIADGKTPDEVLQFTLKNLSSWGLKPVKQGLITSLRKDRFNYIPANTTSDGTVRERLIAHLENNKQEFIQLFDQQAEQWARIRGIDSTKVSRRWLDESGNWSKEFLDSVKFVPDYDQRQLDIPPGTNSGYPGATFRMMIGNLPIDTYLPDGTNILSLTDLNAPKRYVSPEWEQPSILEYTVQ